MVMLEQERLVISCLTAAEVWWWLKAIIEVQLCAFGAVRVGKLIEIGRNCAESRIILWVVYCSRASVDKS